MRARCSALRSSLLAAVAGLGCVSHLAVNEAFDPETGAMTSRTWIVDLNVIRVSETSAAVGPEAMVVAPEQRPIQKPNETDETVAEQFERLVEQLEAEGRLRKGLIDPPEDRATHIVRGGIFAYHTKDREASEDLGQIVRTGIMAFFWSQVIGAAGEGASTLWDYVDSQF